MSFVKPSFVAAPLFLALYGVLRLIGKADGVYGPGWDWQAAHFAGIIGLVLFAPVVLALGRMLRPSWWRTTIVGVTLVGLVASVVQFGADIVEGFMAADKPEMSSLSDSFSSIPGVTIAFYSVGPQLFFLGLIVLAVAAAIARKLPWWSAVLVIVGILLPPVTLDLMPIAGLCLAAAFAPVVFRRTPVAA
ncbi:hypothetical protein HDA40_002877 [Hamadaea flava]|uniref:Uncharacterized protein n=1 Tax=Hamadaea flava TaxID=1742688 RepID=A0ABV8LH97_9ACTN|nr:hypothetical protein [Hamadaea flava]MCP2324370.1 hypothetical protein [Hamadaea flava]